MVWYLVILLFGCIGFTQRVSRDRGSLRRREGKRIAGRRVGTQAPSTGSPVDPIGTPEADPRIHLGIALVWPMGLILDLVRAVL